MRIAIPPYTLRAWPACGRRGVTVADLCATTRAERIAVVRDMRCSQGNRTELRGPTTAERCRTGKQLNPWRGPMSKIENTRNARVLQDHELNLVSGGAGRPFAVDIGTSEQLVSRSVARTGFIDASQVYGVAE